MNNGESAEEANGWELGLGRGSPKGLVCKCGNLTLNSKP